MKLIWERGDEYVVTCRASATASGDAPNSI
jgi:hypothetical protein